MDPYAVVETGGKQYLVHKGDELLTERIEIEATLTVGTPAVPGAQVRALVVEHLRGPKVVSFKKKRRKGYHKKIGHRQELMKLKIEELQAG